MVRMWLGECCRQVEAVSNSRQVEAEEVSNSRNKIHQTTYKPLFRALYIRSLHWGRGYQKMSQKCGRSGEFDKGESKNLADISN